jgi:hypothetical protein
MSFSAGILRHGASNSEAKLKAEVPFHLRLRNHIQWWEQHSSNEVLTLIMAGVTSIIPTSSNAIRQALHQGPGGNKNGFGNFGGFHPSRGSKANTSQSGQTFNSLVCDKKGGKTQANYRLQRGKSLPATKTFQVGELARNVSFLEKRNVGSQK